MPEDPGQKVRPAPGPVILQPGAVLAFHVDLEAIPKTQPEMRGQPPAPDHRDIEGLLRAGNRRPEGRNLRAVNQRRDLALFLGRGIVTQIIRQRDAGFLALDMQGKPPAIAAGAPTAEILEGNAYETI